MDSYYNLREKYLEQQTNPRIVLKSTNCSTKAYVLMTIIDKSLYLLGVAGLVIFGSTTDNVGLAFVFIILFSIFGFTLKLWFPRTVGMRIMGLIYVKNYDCLPIDKKTSMMLYSYQKQYALQENEEFLSRYVSEGTHFGFERRIVPLYNEYHQTRAMMVNGVFLVKLKPYNLFRTDFLIDELAKKLKEPQAVSEREDSPILSKSNDQIFKDH